jgi:DNA topoisomerase-1
MMQEFYDKFHPSVKEVEEHAERESGERILGIHPESGKPISVRLGKFGPMAQIGAPDDEEKKFASLMADQNIGNISLEEALKLFLLPKNLGIYKGEEIEINNGRFGPYIKFGATFISIPKGENPTDVALERAQELIDEKTLADAPIAIYKGEGVQKGVGRFGPFIKWNSIFINVSRKYNFDNLTQSDIEELIEDKLQKNIDKVLHDWKEEGIIVEKARWGRSVILKGKLKIELGKEIDAAGLSLEQVQEIIAKKAPAKKTATKKPAAKKSPAKKVAAKKK